MLCCGSVACWYDESDDDAQSLRMEETRDDVLPAGEWPRAHVMGFVRTPPRWAPPEIGTGDFASSCRTRLATQRVWFSNGWSRIGVESAADSTAPSALVKEEPPSDVMTEEHDASEPASDPDHASLIISPRVGLWRRSKWGCNNDVIMTCKEKGQKWGGGAAPCGVAKGSFTRSGRPPSLLSRATLPTKRGARTRKGDVGTRLDMAGADFW